MTEKSTVIYNGSCPICSREVGVYRREAAEIGAPLDFTDLTASESPVAELTVDQAARRFHVLTPDGTLHAGVDAFLVLWAELPRWRWLARLLSLPVLRQIAHLGYEWMAAPLLYRLHLRREARKAAA